MKYNPLGQTGMNVSRLSFGASALGGVYGNVDEAEGIRAVHTALDLGINYFDVAPAYGGTVAETVLGKALKGIPRDRYYLSTKVGKYTTAGGFGQNTFDFSRARIRASLDESAGRLRDVPADAALVHSHYTLNDRTALELLPDATARGIGIINAAPFSAGLLSGREGPAWHPASDRERRLFREAAAFCQQQGVPINKLAIQFSSQNPVFPTTLFSTTRSESVRHNVAWVDELYDTGLVAEVERILEPVMNHQWDYDQGVARFAEKRGT